MWAFGSETLTWDVRNLLVGLSQPGTTASFVYDYANRRTSKTINGTHTSLLNDGEDLVSEITSGTAVNTLQSPFVDEPIARNGLYLTPNHLGSTTPLTNCSGNLAEQYFYLPFGQTWQSAGTTNPFEFTGRENDGTGLYFYRNRYYSPDLGRFASEDPIGMAGGGSEYAYAADDPEDAIDPAGLVHLVVTIAGNGQDDRSGTLQVYADAGDVIPQPPGLEALGITPWAATGGESLGSFDIGNNVAHWWNSPGDVHHGGTHDPSGYGPFPAGEFPITGVARVYKTKKDPDALKKFGHWKVIIGGGVPSKRQLLIHAGRSGWWCTTFGCLRVDADVLDWLIAVLNVNIDGSRLTVIDPSQKKADSISGRLEY